MQNQTENPCLSTIRLFIILTSINALTACGNGGSGGDTPNAPTSVLTEIETEPPIDYSKITCGNMSACSQACQLDNPTVTDAQRKEACKSVYISDSICAGAAQWVRETMTAPQIDCRSRKVTEVLTQTDIESPLCGDIPECRAICDRQGPVPVQEIIRMYGTGNSTALKSAIYNQARNQIKSSCYVTPMSFVLDWRIVD